MRIGLSSPQDFLALIVRRKWWVIAPFIALSCAVAVLTRFLPKVYISETLILVRPREVPEDFVKDLIAGTAEERLRTIEQTILSRTNLVQILREFGDRLPDFRPLNMDDQVVKLRKQIDVVFELEKRDGVTLPLTYFRVSYQDRDPELAQKIAAKLTALFIEQDNRVRESQVFGTTEFFSAEVDKVAELLRQSEAKLKEVKSARQFELPDQREANLRTLDRYVQDKKTNVEALDRFTSTRLNLESLISQTPETIPKPSPPLPPAARNPQLEEYRKAQHDYEDAAAKYTPKHPEVQIAKARLDRLKEQIPADILKAELEAATSAATETTVPTEPNPLYQKLVTQLQEVKTELAIREKEKLWIESEIAKYSRRVENTPKTEQDIADVVRHNEDLKKQDTDLKNKLAQARLAESLESKQKGSQFQVIDPANYPIVPAKPNKLSVLFGGAIASLALSIGFAALVDIGRQKVWTQSQVEAFWGVPVLVDIPEILTDSDLKMRRRKKFVYAASSVAGALAWSVCLYVIYLKHGFILQHLDPILQKVIYK